MLTHPQGHTHLLMVVEDSDEDFDTVVEAVKTSGVLVNVHRAMTGDACLDYLLGEGVAPIRPSMVLLDLNTPGTDGRETLRIIKSDPSLRSLPIVVHTTSSNPKDLEYCYDAGANAYHVKPLRYLDHKQVLLEVLRYWLNRVAVPEVRRPPYDR